MGMMDAVRAVFSKYVTFSGRASRSEFWWFYLFTVLINFALQAVQMILVTVAVGSIDPNASNFEDANGMLIGITAVFGILMLVFALAILLPFISVTVRRLHDTGRSGWWYWIALVPIVGIILLIVWLASSSDEGDNQYGASPHGPAVDAGTFA